jgi:hypothetical protein
LIKIFIEKLIYLRIYRFPLNDSATGKCSTWISFAWG